MSRSPPVSSVAASVSEWFRRKLALFLTATLLLPTFALCADTWITSTPSPAGFALATAAQTSPIVYSANDAKVVSLAAQDLAADIERVTGRKPVVRTDTTGLVSPAVFVGTLGHAPLIDALIATGKFAVGDLRGKWESFVIATVANPQPGVSSALVIVGSDRRGTAFGVYELSQAIGVSPWHWWADVVPAPRDALYVAAGTRRFGPPSVKYRGIFLNDEDWGLQPWAAKTFEPEVGDIGPKTYAKLFELMLRLKANTVWPAMHAVTKPFNFYPQNKLVADDYAIVMGSSHAEPMLRNNVGEWKDKPERYNYVTNREGVRAYWEQRVQENGKFENIYTLGMRGVHDSGIQGARTDAERVRVLEQTFADQRAMIARHVRPEVEQVPQMFCAYKEVLGLYRQGLKVPDDVTIVWPDDNFGYVRNFASAAERTRAGGFGVYYHLSYLGAPMAYLWLSTIPPALIWEEMTKAYDHGARTIWIANVGDLKPAEIGTEFFLQLAWDIGRWRRDHLDDFLREWAAREFGVAPAPEIAAIMRDYYRLNFQRKPEHLQWWLPKETPRASALSDGEIAERREAFDALRQRLNRLSPTLSENQRDSFHELVLYPVGSSIMANQRFFDGERLVTAASLTPKQREMFSLNSKIADKNLGASEAMVNDSVAGGKWRGMYRIEPADEQWKSFRLSRWSPPQYVRPPAPVAGPGGFISLEAERFTRKTAQAGVAWEIIPGLGRTGEGSVAIFPTTAASIAVDQLAGAAPRLDYEVRFGAAGEFPVILYLIPTHSLAGGALRLGLALDDAPPQLVALDVKDGGAEWAQGVLNATRTASAKLTVPSAGAHTLRVFMVDAGVVLDKLVVDCGGLTPSYLGPADTRAALPR